jgi:aminopeptidase YwaD
MRKHVMFAVLFLLGLNLVFSQSDETAPKTLLPLSLLREIVNEVSGDVALQNEIFLTGVNRNKLPAEYLQGHFETKFLLEKLREYGIKDSEIVELPREEEKAWDAEMAELWIVKPEKRKIADLRDIAATLCEGSASSDLTAELVYVGPGYEEDFYKGKNVKGKIILVNGYAGAAQRVGVEKYGASGIVAYSSSHPEFDPDEVGWGWVDSKKKKTFGFMISTRLGQDLRDRLEQGEKITLRAVCKANMVPYREEMVSALLKGKEAPQEELVFTAHLFEGFAKQGANDDVSGCVAILETARALKALQDDGRIPPLKRSVRFLFVPEISGTAAYIKKYPEVAKRFFANINEDMVGEAILKNHAYFCLVTTPLSLPTYLNDAVASFVEWVGKTQRDSFAEWGGDIPIVSPTGTRDPFYTAVDRFASGSDHIVFVDGRVRVPAVFFIVWPDMWYHSSGDTPDKSDSTQLKRVAFLGAAAGLFLANAGPAEAELIMSEVTARGLARVGKDQSRAESMVRQAELKGIHAVYKEARDVIDQAVWREKEALSSVRFFIGGDGEASKILEARLKRAEDMRPQLLLNLEEVYALRCAKEKIAPQKPALTKEEIRLDGLVPVRTEKMGDVMDYYKTMDKMGGKVKYSAPDRIMEAEFELRNFIDGKRSLLEIRNAASVEYGSLPLADVEAFMKLLEKLGMIEIRKK